MVSFSHEYRAYRMVDRVLDGVEGAPGVDLDDLTGPVVDARTATETRDVFATVHHGEAIDWAHHTKQLFPAAAIFTYERETANDGALVLGPWELKRIQLFGRQAKKDGSPSQTPADTAYSGSSFGEAPEWLLSYGQQNTPTEKLESV